MKLIKSAEGEALRFSKLYKEYKKSPEVTRERLYIESVESVLGSSTKVMIDIDGGNNLLYLPLDKILEPRMQNSSTGINSENSSKNSSLSNKIQNSRDGFNLRKRDLYSE